MKKLLTFILILLATVITSDGILTNQQKTKPEKGVIIRLNGYQEHKQRQIRNSDNSDIDANAQQFNTHHNKNFNVYEDKLEDLIKIINQLENTLDDLAQIILNIDANLLNSSIDDILNFLPKDHILRDIGSSSSKNEIFEWIAGDFHNLLLQTNCFFTDSHEYIGSINSKKEKDYQFKKVKILFINIVKKYSNLFKYTSENKILFKNFKYYNNLFKQQIEKSYLMKKIIINNPNAMDIDSDTEL